MVRRVTQMEMTGMTGMIDTGDIVTHGPTGETWVVACVVSDEVTPCGWPLSYARLDDCTLVQKATPEDRAFLLGQMCEIPEYSDPRVRYARLTMGLD